MATFNPPTQEQAMDDFFWGRYSVPVGISVVKQGGHFVRLPTPTNDELVAAGVEGIDWFRGGYEYANVPADVAYALVADGFSPHVIGYGFGPYGQTPYGGS